MPSKYQIISELASQTARDITSKAERYTDFLVTAANNYKYSFKEQLLIHAQKPDATACAEIETWNRLGRWVNKGTRGIALLVDRDTPYKLRHVFDYSDTNSRAGRVVTLWQMRPQYEEPVKESLQDSFGEVELTADFPHFIMEIAKNAVEDMSMFKETADIQTADMLNLPVPEAHYHNIVLKPSEAQKKMVEGLSERAERVRNKMVDSSTDNMLLITNDGRKLALDQRLMNDMLPDSETSKVSACADNVFDIWQRTAESRSTQMVFCDLSTPHNDGKFNVYDDLRKKLIEKGIPVEEIAYIHTAETEAKKKELFGKVRSGQIRVLLGSTQKMGAGTNVQTKLVALHHLDCPWRPSDLQQREGRIIRQGNENPEVDIYTYVTENTFDSYLYQLVEGKQKFIGQIMTSKSPVRSAEDIDETALSYAEIKALCAGNPHIKEKMDLDIDVSRLKLLKANHLSQRYALEDQIIKEFPQKIKSLEQRIDGYKADMAQLAQNTLPNEDGFSSMIMAGGTVTDKKAAGEAIIGLCKSMTNPDPIHIGEYRGFDMELFFDSFSREYKITLKHELRHTVTLGTDIFGNIQRLDNALNSFQEKLTACEAQLENTKVQLENAKLEAQKPFPQEDELKTKTARLNELNAMLNLDKRENEIVDGERAEEEPSRSSDDRER